MRKLVYECYYKNEYVKTVTTLKEAEEWKKENNKNKVKESLIPVKEKSKK